MIHYQNGIGYTLDNGEEARSFTERIKKEFGNLPGTNICHTISYHAIMQALVFGLQAFEQGELDMAKQYITGIIQAVTAVDVENRDEFGADADAVRIQCLKTENLLLKLSIAATDQICKMANDILWLLNNCISNLRRGDASWNKLVSSDFDPKHWVYYEKGDEPGEGQIRATEQGICWKDESEYDGVDFYETGLYLLDPTDQLKIDILISCGLGGVLTIGRYHIADDIVCIASSDNTFSHKKHSGADFEMTESVQVYYYARGDLYEVFDL